MWIEMAGVIAGLIIAMVAIAIVAHVFGWIMMKMEINNDKEG